jgi:hypothetical protein
MKETIYAKTLNPELFDYRVYDIREDDGNEVIIDGGRDYHNIDNKGYLAAIKKLIEEYDSYTYDYYYHGSIKAFLNDMLPKKENGKRLSPKEIRNIKCVLMCYGSDYKETVICECLSTITGKIYRCKGLRGCCQGEYVDAYYPVEDNITKYLDWIEAWFFGTGTEILIYDGDLEPETADDIEDGYTIYTANWRVEDLKKEIRDYVGAKDDVEVKLWLYDKTRTIRIDEYKLAD